MPDPQEQKLHEVVNSLMFALCPQRNRLLYPPSGAFLLLKQYFDFEDDRYCHFPQSLFSLGLFSLLLKQSSGLLISYRFYGCDE